MSRRTNYFGLWKRLAQQKAFNVHLHYDMDPRDIAYSLNAMEDFVALETERDQLAERVRELEVIVAVRSESWLNTADALSESEHHFKIATENLAEVEADRVELAELEARCARALGDAGIELTESLYDGVITAINRAHDLKCERDEWKARAEAAERVAEATDAWVKWEWENPVSGCDMELDDIQATCERLQSGVFTALAAWRKTRP